MREIDPMARGGVQTTDNMNHRMNDSITQIKVLSVSALSIFTLRSNQNANTALCHRNRNVDGDQGIGGILDTIIGTTSTIIHVFDEASGLIPIPYMKPLVTSVACLLTAVQVSIPSFVFRI